MSTVIRNQNSSRNLMEKTSERGNFLARLRKLAIQLLIATIAVFGLQVGGASVASADDLAIATPTTGLTGTAGTAYTLTLAEATGGTAPYTYEVTTGTLPAGLTLDGNIISGTPTEAGTSAIVITATDTADPAATAATSSFSIVIGSAAVVLAAAPVTVSIPSQPAIAVVVPASLEVGKTATLTTTGGAATGTNNFLSNSPTICTVTSAGVVTAVAAGTCSVYAQRTAPGFTTAVSADVTFKIMSAAEVKAIADAAVKAAADKAAADAAAAAVKAAADKAEAEVKAAEAAAAVAAEAARVEAVRLAGLNTVTSIKTVKGKTSVALNLADKYYGYILELQLRTVVKGKVRFTTIEYFAVQRENGVVTVSTRAKIAKGQQMRIMSEGKAVRYFRR